MEADSRTEPSVTIQVEGEGQEEIVLTASTLRAYARALARCWRFLGVSKGDKVIIFDYGTSPMVFLANSAFVPYLDRGASELLGCIPLCCDGASQLASRTVRAARLIAPEALFVRPDCLLPLRETAEKEGGDGLWRRLRFIAVSQNERVMKQTACEDWSRRTGIPTHSVARSDEGLFISPRCPACGMCHIWPDLYRLRILHPDTHLPRKDGADGLVAIQTLFAGNPSWHISGLWGRLVPRGCSRGYQDPRLSI